MPNTFTSNTFQTLTFRFEGKAEFNGPEATNADEASIVDEMNKKAENTAHQIEREIRKVSPPEFSVLAEVSFSKGSLVMTGTVFLFTWLSSVAATTVREEFENPLKEVIRITVRRVFSQVIQDLKKLPNLNTISFTPLDIDPIRTSFSPGFIPPSQNSLEIQQPGVSTQKPTIRLPIWLNPVIVLLFANLLLTFFLVLENLTISITPKAADTSKVSPSTPAAIATSTPSKSP